jgi:hypothetical protein
LEKDGEVLIGELAELDHYQRFSGRTFPL